eukprot:2837059-Lingulodinium_polyedra.AAC.1
MQHAPDEAWPGYAELLWEEVRYLTGQEMGLGPWPGEHPRMVWQLGMPVDRRRGWAPLARAQ